MDIKAKINELVDKIKNDDSLRAEFQSNPIKAVEKLIGIDLPDDMVEKIVDGVKAKLTTDKLAGVADKFKSLF